jgi:23S rRNA-/tRNA-specific pseudouridylate synthase
MVIFISFIFFLKTATEATLQVKGRKKKKRIFDSVCDSTKKKKLKKTMRRCLNSSTTPGGGSSIIVKHLHPRRSHLPCLLNQQQIRPLSHASGPSTGGRQNPFFAASSAAASSSTSVAPDFGIPQMQRQTEPAQRHAPHYATTYAEDFASDGDMKNGMMTQQQQQFAGTTSGGMKFTPDGIRALDQLDPTQVHSEYRMAKPTHDPAASPLLQSESAEERRIRLRHYRPLTLVERERISSDSANKTYHEITSESGFGDRVDEHVRRLYPELSKETARKLIENGHIYRYRRNGKRRYTRVTDRLELGEMLVVPTAEFWKTTRIQPPVGVIGGDKSKQDTMTRTAPAAASSTAIASAPRSDKRAGVAARHLAGEMHSPEEAEQRGRADAEERRRSVHLSYKVRQEAVDWVLFKNAYTVIINKPAGVPMHPTSDGTLNVSDMLGAWKFTMGQKPLISNLLDKDTSGIVVLSRTADTHRMMGRMFKKRAVPVSCYWGLTVGTPKASWGRIKMHLEINRAAGGNQIIARPNATPESRVAQAEYVVNASAAEYASFISYYPMTTLSHQLRIMSAHALRTPLLGDARYGGTAAVPQSLHAFWDPQQRGQVPLHLHHRKIQLPYKRRNGEFECVTAPLPAFFEDTMKKLGWRTDADDPLIPG